MSALNKLEATKTVICTIRLFPPHERSQMRAILAREPLRSSSFSSSVSVFRALRAARGAAACEVVVTTGRITDFIGTQPRPTRFRKSSPKAGTVRCRPSTRRS